MKIVLVVVVGDIVKGICVKQIIQKMRRREYDVGEWKEGRRKREKDV